MRTATAPFEVERNTHAIATAFVRTNSSRPSRPPSRPKPEMPTPAEGQLAADNRRGAVHVDAAGLKAWRDPVDSPDVVGPEVRREPVGGPVGDRHRLVLGVEAHQREHRAEDLDLAELAVGAHVAEDGRFHVEAVGEFATGDAAPDEQLSGTIGLGSFDHGDDPFLGLSGDHGSHPRGGIERIAQRRCRG